MFGFDLNMTIVEFIWLYGPIAKPAGGSHVVVLFSAYLNKTTRSLMTCLRDFEAPKFVREDVMITAAQIEYRIVIIAELQDKYRTCCRGRQIWQGRAVILGVSTVRCAWSSLGMYIILALSQVLSQPITFSKERSLPPLAPSPTSPCNRRRPRQI